MKQNLFSLLLLSLLTAACGSKQSGERNGDAGDQTDTATIFQDTVKTTTNDSPMRQKKERLKTDTSHKNR